jgi:hypothetical protein
MWTPDSSRLTTATTKQLVAAVALGALAVVVAAVGFTAVGHPASARGAIFGGGAMIPLLVALRWRAAHRPGEAGTVARVGAGLGDERDRAILTFALAAGGLFAFVTLWALSFAILCGASPVPSVAVASVAQVGVFVVAFAVRARRA